MGCGAGGKPHETPTIPLREAGRLRGVDTAGPEADAADSRPARGGTSEVVVARTAHPLPSARTAVADVDHGLATGAVVLGVVALVLVALDAARPGVVVGLVGMVLALGAQMQSRTRAERFVDMAALLACFVAVAVGIRDGGGF